MHAHMYILLYIYMYVYISIVSALTIYSSSFFLLDVFFSLHYLCYIISSVNFTGPLGAQIFGQILFWVCLFWEDVFG